MTHWLRFRIPLPEILYHIFQPMGLIIDFSNAIIIIFVIYLMNGGNLSVTSKVCLALY